MIEKEVEIEANSKKKIKEGLALIGLSVKDIKKYSQYN